MAHQHILGYLVPYDGENMILQRWRYNQGYLAMIKAPKNVYIVYHPSCSLVALHWATSVQ